jgi:hypothetical protein
MGNRNMPDSPIQTFTKRILRDFEVMQRWAANKNRYASALRRNLALGQTEVGNSLLIVANGPSAENLSQNFYRKFKAHGGRVMGMNWAHLNPVIAEEKIDYYLSADRRMVENSEKSFGLRKYLSEQKNLTGFVPEIRLNQWEEISPETSFVPFCHYYVKHMRMPWWGLSPLYPKAFTAHSGLHALQIATWLGFEKIFIVGFDNSYFREFKLTGNNELLRTNSHAGEKSEKFLYEGDTASFLERQAMLFRDYWLFSSGPIWNLDIESATDAFDKKSPTEALQLLGSSSSE